MLTNDCLTCQIQTTIKRYGTYLLPLVLLQFADMISTYIALTTVPGAYEANPIMASVMDSIGILYGMLLMKITYISIVMFILIFTDSAIQEKRLKTMIMVNKISLSIAILIFYVVVSWNIFIYKGVIP